MESKGEQTGMCGCGSADGAATRNAGQFAREIGSAIVFETPGIQETRSTKLWVVAMEMAEVTMLPMRGEGEWDLPNAPTAPVLSEYICTCPPAKTWWKVEIASKMAATSMRVEPVDSDLLVCVIGEIWKWAGMTMNVHSPECGRKTPRPVPDASQNTNVGFGRGSSSAASAAIGRGLMEETWSNHQRSSSCMPREVTAGVKGRVLTVCFVMEITRYKYCKCDFPPGTRQVMDCSLPVTDSTVKRVGLERPAKEMADKMDWTRVGGIVTEREGMSHKRPLNRATVC